MRRRSNVSRRERELLIREARKDRLSVIKTRGREALLDYEKELKKRKALKRIYFTEALNHIKQHEYEEAINLYKKSITPLINRHDYNLAGVSYFHNKILLNKFQYKN
ncbi:hypothetical protein LCGC14_1640360 [marine sediment metagenome]|uniref:Uncharacterized protein n=1 Tax=marine sediment metagenome TaxID=412755 RepID=A0A0F9KZF6_9ZZZZ